MTEPTPMAMDIRLMNMAAALLLGAFVLLALVSATRWVARQATFDIQGISVRGDVAHNNIPSMRANVLPQVRGTFFTLDLPAIRKAYESMPWVRQAVVRRDFPNRLRVELQEHQPVAYWGAEGDSRMLNSYGEVFDANIDEVEPNTLPRLAGPAGLGPQVWDMYQTLLAPLNRVGMELVQVELSARGNWRIGLESGARLELGSGDRAAVLQRTERFLQTLPAVTQRYGRNTGTLEYADLRYEQAYALRLRGVTTLALAAPK
jgi:cell division protein FtsQ